GDNASPCVQLSPGCVGGFAGYKAGPGYDLATGLGSVDAAGMVTQWTVTTPSTTILTIDPPAFNPNDTVRLTATVRGGATVTGAVVFLAQNGFDTALGTASLSGSGTATIDVPGRSLLASTGTIAALYTGDAANEASFGTFKIEAPAPSSSHVVAVVG